MIYSYIIYLSMVLTSVFFAFFAQKYRRENKKKTVVPHPVFMFLSMLPLIFIMGFRDLSIGVDGYSYLSGYNYANSTTVFQYYRTSVTEPGFYLLYRIAYLLGDFQWLLIFAATITIYFFYKSLSYEVNNINFALIVFIFATTQYFYYFGIMRMGIAAAIIAFAYRYIIENNKKKFILFMLFATMFHYSALFAILFLLLKKNKNNYFKKKNLLKLAIVIPISFLVLKYLIYPFITADRYQNYIDSSEIISLGFVTTIPILGLFALHYNRFVKISYNFQFYFFLFVIKIVTEIFAPLIGIGRMVWYVNLSICFLFPAIIKLNKDKGIKVILLAITILYCLMYSYLAYFGDSPRGQTMLPYRNLFFWFSK
ncbi:EpsG family protein [Bacillus sp. CFBP9009]